MPNWCSNNLKVVGPAASVEEFVRLASSDVRTQYAPHGSFAIPMARYVQAGHPANVAARMVERDIENLGGGPAFPEIAEIYDAQRARQGKPPATLFDRLDPRVQHMVRNGDVEGVLGHFRACSAAEPEDEGTPEKTFLNLEALIPVPPEITSYGFDPAGYEWCVRNWGCKWNLDVSEARIWRAEETFRSADAGRGPAVLLGVASYPVFSSPWSPPLQALCAASGRFPDLAFVVAWAEEGDEEFGAACIRDGDISGRFQPSHSDIQQFREVDEDEDCELLRVDDLMEYMSQVVAESAELDIPACPVPVSLPSPSGP